MSRSFTPTTDGINMGFSSPLGTISTPFTLSAWCYPTVNADGIIWGILGTGAEVAVLRYDRVGAGFIDWVGTNAAGGSWHAISTTTSASVLNTWFHVLGTNNGTNSIIYINGANQNSASSGAGIFSTGSRGFFCGHDFANGGTTPTARIAECAVWNTTLTAGEILALSGGALPFQIRSGNLLGYWPLNGLQSPEPDFSGNANNGTVTGTALAPGPPVMMLTPRGQLKRATLPPPPISAVFFPVAEHRYIIPGRVS